MEEISSFDKNNQTIRYWSSLPLEDSCIEQAINLSKHPSVVLPVVLMPDTHTGYGMPIGGVIGCKDIIPNAVGVDIGCGMIFRNTKLDANSFSKQDLRNMAEKIKSVIPTGFNHRKEAIEWEEFDDPPATRIVLDELDSAKHQLGTLGGGNHFIELQKDENNELHIMIHSGSRNLGFKICKEYNKIAAELNNDWHSSVPSEWELAFLPIHSEEGQNYIQSMDFALKFAKENRRIMMEEIFKALEINFYDELDIHHNYAVQENHLGKNVWIHRKGAIRVQKNELGIIPGSMGTNSFIVEGIGNILSYNSASHGAGRNESRTSASERITQEEADKSMEGIIYDRWSKIQRGRLKGKLDFSECPLAYKDIHRVISDESDIVKVVKTLTPIAVIKGE